MDNILTNGKRVLAVAVSAATILWAVGIAAFAVPQTASAATGGDVIKGESLSALYYYGYDGQRYTFPNEKTFFTWFDSFEQADIQTMSDDGVADLTLAGNVVYRPGSVWIKITSAANTYAVAPNGAIHWIETEAVATDYAGSDWNTIIEDVPDVFFADYTEGASLMSATAFDGMMYMDGGNHYLAWDGEMRMVDADGLDGNRMQDRFFLDGAGIDDSALTSGADITGNICDLTDVAQTGCVDTSGGDLTVSLASDTPASMTIPDTASGVEVASFTFSADEATTLNSLAVHLTGLANEDDIANSGVYLYEGNQRLTDGRTVNASTKKATFAGLGLDFADAQDRDLSVRVDMGDNDQNRTFAFEVADADDVDTNGSASGSFPVTGNTHTIVDLTVGEITVDKTGSVNDPTLGEADAVVAKFNLAANNEEDVWVEAITLNVEQADDHSNFQLWQGGTEVAVATLLGNDKVLFELDTPFLLEDGTDRDFSMSLDVGGDAGDEIKTWVDNDSDIQAVGDDFGFGVSVVRNGYDGGTNDAAEDGGNCAADGDDCSFVTTEGGEFTVVHNGPTAEDIMNGADDVVIYDFTATAERFTNVDGFELRIFGTDLFDVDNTITDIRIVDATDGSLIAGPEELDEGDDDQEVDFTDSFSIAGGEALNMQATVDVDETYADEGDEITAELDQSEWDIEDENGDAITDIVPSSDLTGNPQTVIDAGLTVSLASVPSGETEYVKGAMDVVGAGFNFTAGTGSDIEVTDATVHVYVDIDGDDTFDEATGDLDTATAEERISSCSLVDDADDTVIDGPVSPDADGDLLFESFSWWVTAGDTGTANVECDLANVSPLTTDEFAFGIAAAATDVDALDEEGDSVDPDAAAVNTTPDVTISVADTGELSVSVAADSPDDGFLLTGSTMQEVSVFRFDADLESFEVNRLTVTEEQGEDDDETGGENSNVYANNVSKVYVTYPLEDGTEETKSGSLTGNERTFDGTAFWVEQDDNAKVRVAVDVSATNRAAGSAESNERLRMGLSANSGESEFRAVGQDSNETLNEDSDEASSGETFQDHFAGESAFGNGDLDTISDDADLGNFRIRETIPTITLNASTPSGSGFVPGDQEVLRINVAANSNEDVILENIIFDMASQDGAGDGWNLCDADGDAGGAGEPGLAASHFDFYGTGVDQSGTSTALDVDGDWTLLASDGSECTEDTDVVEFALLALTGVETVPAGSTYTYSLYFDSSNASGPDDDSIQFLVAGDPIVGTFLSPTTDSQLQEALNSTDTTVTVSDSSDFTLGDVLCMDTGDDGCGATDERMLLVEIVDGSTIEVVRGYLNSTPDTSANNTANDDIDRMPGALLWQDDGNDTIVDAEEERFGANMVDELPLTGNNAMSF